MTDKAYAVPLHELLAGVPRNTRLEITDPDGYGTRFIPVGRYCHEAAEALRTALAQPEPEPEPVAWEQFYPDMGKPKTLHTALAQPEPAECDGGQCGIGGYCKQCPKTQPEPVAWISHNAGLYHGKPDESLNPLPLYLAPPQREWVGLTDEDIQGLHYQIKVKGMGAYSTEDIYRAIEAKLKEKNT